VSGAIPLSDKSDSFLAQIFVNHNSWQERYKHKLSSPEDALKCIKSGDRVFISSACAEPQLLVKELEKVGTKLADAEIVHTLTLGAAPYTEAKFTNNFRHSAFFIGPNVRQAVSEGRADYVPTFLSEVPAVFKSGRIPIDVALIQVSPPDKHGFCSYGISVDIVKSAAESAKIVIAEVNPQMPRTLGDSFIPADDIDFLVENDAPILEVNPVIPDEAVASKIAENVAQLIEDGDTFQIGIGRVPHAILPLLKDKKDLGVHTEVFDDGIIDLIESGAVTCKKKTLCPRKIVASFCMGTRRLYDFINNNPFFEFRPSDYTCDPFVISQNNKMVAINAALEVDFTGQVCADSLGHLFYSGIGGHCDFIRGAARSKGGKPIIVLPSTTRDGLRSRIVPHLSEGAGVVTTRGDVHYVVTEYGIANLHGRNVRHRTMDLIRIAHPKFREELLVAAKKFHYVYSDQILPPKTARYPKELETNETFKDNLVIFFRPAKPIDERLLQEFFYSLSDKSTYHRYFTSKKTLLHREAQWLVNLDYKERMAIVGIMKDEKGNEKIVAVGRYDLMSSTDMAEVAFTVSDQYQGRGVGKFLLKYLIQIAKERGILGFTAEVLATNPGMLRVFQKSGYAIKSVLDKDAYSISFRF
jgi:acyl-CoA hydrolase/GNAT superfamily N-acetyltransferase